MIKFKLQKAIYRSEYAYKFYVENKYYLQAKRIYNSNKLVYKLLEKYLLECDEFEKKDICDYLFHLDDWMNQFDYYSQEIYDHEEPFVFERCSGAIPYPNNIVEKLKK